MTGENPVKLRADMALLTALNAAFAVSENPYWIFGGDEPGEELAKHQALIVQKVAEFQRSVRDGVPETLYVVARGTAERAQHGFAPTYVGKPWGDLEPAIRRSFRAFQSALNDVDREIAEAKLELAYQEDLKRPPPPLPDPEGTPFEPTPNILDRVNYGR
jgi:hypothetical protein